MLEIGNESSDEEELHELYDQLERERAHQRNLQPHVRHQQLAQDPDSVICCWF